MGVLDPGCPIGSANEILQTTAEMRTLTTIVPKAEPKVDEPKVEAKVEEPKTEDKIEAPKVETKVERSRSWNNLQNAQSRGDGRRCV